MDCRFRDYDLNQPLLLPPDLMDWLPEDHLARLVCETLDELDLSAFWPAASSGVLGGRPSYHWLLMVRLLAYAYCTGTYSSRRIEARTYDDVAYRFLTADQHPDHDTIATFRKRHLQALEGLFKQILELCKQAGMVKLGHVALDGSKVRANASKHKAMSYERMQPAEEKLEMEIVDLKKTARELLERAEQVDAEEDERYGRGNRGDGIPEELARRETRLKAIRKAKAELEAAKAKAAAEEAERKSKQPDQVPEEGADGHPAQVPDAQDLMPDPKAQRNFTDPDSRIMIDGATKSFVQAYNTQICVDEECQVIVAAEVTQETNDVRQLVPMVERVAQETGRLPDIVSADAGYFSEQNVTDKRLEGVDLHIPPQRQKHGHASFAAYTYTLTLAAMTLLGLLYRRPRTRKISRVAKSLQEQAFLAAFATTATLMPGPSLLPIRIPTARDAMRHKLRSDRGKEVYKRRKAIVEPVYGQIKFCRGFDRFSFRGLRNVTGEWKFVAAVHNLLKLIKFRTTKAGRTVLAVGS